jgi:hypothetical protein
MLRTTGDIVTQHEVCAQIRSAMVPSSTYIQPTLVQQSAWKSNSRKFAVASVPLSSAASASEWPGGTVLGSKRTYQVAFVAPLCSKALRLATLQLPENFSPIGPDQTRLHLYSSRIRLSTAPQTICSPPGSRSGYRFPTGTSRSARFAGALSPGCVPWRRHAWPWQQSCASCPAAIGPPPSTTSTAPRSSCRREASSVCASVGELQDLLGLLDATEVLSLHGYILPSERASAHVFGLVRRGLRGSVAFLRLPLRRVFPSAFRRIAPLGKEK